MPLHSDTPSNLKTVTKVVTKVVPTVKKYWKNDNGTYSNISIMDGALEPTLAPAVYTMNFDQNRGYFVKFLRTTVDLPTKIYATEFDTTFDKIVRHFTETNKSTGCHLTGTKGTGKSVFSQKLQDYFVTTLGLPVILISNGYYGQDFMNIVNDVGEAIFIFDEFEKTYTEEGDQAKLLSLFDGADSKQKRLMVVISNNANKVSEFFSERSGRINYTLNWEGLSLSLIKEYIDDVLVDKEKQSAVMDWASSVDTVTFDNLEALVKDVNRYPREPIPLLLRDLNISKPIPSKYFKILSAVTAKGEDIELEHIQPHYHKLNLQKSSEVINTSPNTLHPWYAEIKDTLEEYEREDYEYPTKYTSSIRLQSMITTYKPGTLGYEEAITAKVGLGVVLTLTMIKEKEFMYETTGDVT